MTTGQLRTKFDTILGNLNSNPTINFCNAVEAAFEALVLASAISEYARVYGGVRAITHPSSPQFLNQKPGKFRTARAFKVKFNSGQSFYFATDIELYGLAGMKRPLGIKFEADVVVIDKTHIIDIDRIYRGYPAPQHLHSVYECKFGKYNKGQLRELLGLRRHVSFLRGDHVTPIPPQPNALDQRPIVNADPTIAVKMARPYARAFFDMQTQMLYDLQQIVVN
jgi:hypothetical protein